MVMREVATPKLGGGRFSCRFTVHTHQRDSVIIFEAEDRVNSVGVLSLVFDIVLPIPLNLKFCCAIIKILSSRIEGPKLL